VASKNAIPAQSIKNLFACISSATKSTQRELSLPDSSMVQNHYKLHMY